MQRPTFPEGGLDFNYASWRPGPGGVVGGGGVVELRTWVVGLRKVGGGAEKVVGGEGSHMRRWTAWVGEMRWSQPGGASQG